MMMLNGIIIYMPEGLRCLLSPLQAAGKCTFAALLACKILYVPDLMKSSMIQIDMVSINYAETASITNLFITTLLQLLPETL